MKRVKINDRYFFDLEGNGIALKRDLKVYTDERGEHENYTTIGHYGQFKSLTDRLIKELTKDKIKDDEMVSMREFSNLFREAQQEVKELLKECSLDFF